MREIKLRAWDKQKKKWLLFYVPHDFFTNSQLPELHDHWTQFTGLHDKNGKEIYEGDILSICEKKNRVVEWNEKGLAFRFFGSAQMFIQSAGELVVVGNIYENPEFPVSPS